VTEAGNRSMEELERDPMLSKLRAMRAKSEESRSGGHSK